MAVVEFFRDRDFEPDSGPGRLTVAVPGAGAHGQRPVHAGQLRARGLNNRISSVRYQLLEEEPKITTILFGNGDFTGRFFGVTSRHPEVALLPDFIRNRASAIVVIRHDGTEFPALPLTAAARPEIHPVVDRRFRRINVRAVGLLVVRRRGSAELRAAFYPEFAPTKTFVRVDLPVAVTVTGVRYRATVTLFVSFSVSDGRIAGAADRDAVRVSVRRGILSQAIERALRRRARARNTIAEVNDSIARALAPLNGLDRRWRSAYVMPGRPRFPLPPGGYQGRVGDDVSLLVA